MLTLAWATMAAVITPLPQTLASRQHPCPLHMPGLPGRLLMHHLHREVAEQLLQKSPPDEVARVQQAFVELTLRLGPTLERLWEVTTTRGGVSAQHDGRQMSILLPLAGGLCSGALISPLHGAFPQRRQMLQHD